MSVLTLLSVGFRPVDGQTPAGSKLDVAISMASLPKEFSISHLNFLMLHAFLLAAGHQDFRRGAVKLSSSHSSYI